MTQEERLHANHMQRLRRKADPMGHAEQVRRMNLKRKYGITPLEYDNLLIEQGGKCKICGVSYKKYNRELSVDHDHITGEIRGLLCQRCNTLIGYLEKNSKLIPIVYNYLNL